VVSYSTYNIQLAGFSTTTSFKLQMTRQGLSTLTSSHDLVDVTAVNGTLGLKDFLCIMGG